MLWSKKSVQRLRCLINIVTLVIRRHFFFIDQFLNPPKYSKINFLCCFFVAGKISAEDINRVARRMLRSRPSVAALGTLAKLPPYEDIQKALTSKDGRFPNRFSLFR